MAESVLRYCGACGVEEGELHREGCDLELCADCGGQRVGCDCNSGRRYPFISYPLHRCYRCGSDKYSGFLVPDEVWAYYIEPKVRDKVLCRSCFEHIRQVTDTHQGPPPLAAYEIVPDRQTWAAIYARMIAQAEEAGATEVVVELRRQAAMLDAQYAAEESD